MEQLLRAYIGNDGRKLVSPPYDFLRLICNKFEWLFHNGTAATGTFVWQSTKIGIGLDPIPGFAKQWRFPAKRSVALFHNGTVSLVVVVTFTIS